MTERLTDQAVSDGLRSLPGWTRQNDTIRKQFSFADFRAAIAFVNAVADLAESANHHPDITITYNRVLLVLSSHDAGGLTQRDLDLARRIEETELGGRG
jgi:4a-hydroxytetrahydrobiopterin dehydratase